MNKTIKEKIFELSDSEFQKFQRKLCPNINNIVGVRLPLLRKLAKEISKDDWRNFLRTCPTDYFEEIMLQGLVIGYAKADIEEIINHITNFVPKIDNWAVCDSFCTSLKFTKSNMNRVFEFLKTYLESKKEFELRFGIVMLLDFYIVDQYIDQVLILLNEIKHDGYYVKMAVAWALSICYIKYPGRTMIYLKNNNLDDFTYNKALQKITESFRVSKETKSIIRSMKRKK
ncbi:DNA alkylation repair protein [Clostridium saccharobutylicum]|uniref:DNA alkylation repair enzyme n=1 Tax=Clostridium saccharobutylicum TaxID=169679 RepID=A0A1S8NHV2_CLOSA|nr:DNA alkylation repair protein [Clostridium saccharobutylicum]OOM16055.1 DNA alkylation repair enzyme [Clostridium saccharobutylicum]